MSTVDITKPINRYPTIKSIRDNFIAKHDDHNVLNNQVINIKNNIKDPFNYKPIGFNYYSLAYEKIIGYNLADTSRPELLQYIKDSGANLVRFALPAFQSSEFLTYIHNTTTIPTVVNEDNLKTNFKLSVDIAMNSLAEYGLKCMACLNWSQNLVPSVFSETTALAYSNLNSVSSIYSKSFITWFVNKYKDHPAFGIISIGNEYRWDGPGITYPTPVALGIYFSDLVNTIKQIRPGTLVTADLMLPNFNNNQTRRTMDNYIDDMYVITKDLDIINVHSYGPTYNFTGHLTQELSAFTNTPSTWYGFEGIPSLLSTMRNFANAVNKPLVIGEFGIQTDVENDTDKNKKQRFAKYCAAYADCSLLWNIQDTNIASASGQSTINIKNGTDRANTWLPIIQNINKSKPILDIVGAGSKSQRQVIKPKYAIKSDRIGNGTYNINLTTTNAFASSVGYGWMAWISLTGVLNAFENISSFRSSPNNGILIQASDGTNVTDLYSEGRISDGSFVDTNNWAPVMELNEFYHLAFLHVLINNIPATQIWINGLYWRTMDRSTIPSAIPSGQLTYALGNGAGGNGGTGVPVFIQDITLVPYADADDVWKHMRGEILPQSIVHIRGMSNGSILDISKNNTPLIVGSNLKVLAT